MDEGSQDPNAPYKKREIDHQFNDLFNRLDKQDSTLGRILTQTTATNGRVNKLEWWQHAVIWGLGVLWSALLVATPVVVRYIKTQLTTATQAQIDASVKASLKEALSAYNIDYDYQN